MTTSKEMVRGKATAAETMLRACLGRNAVWAAPDRYPYQGWTRDLGMAILPVLVSSGLWHHAKAHLMSLVERQGPDGSIPILFLDGAYAHAHFIVTKLWRSFRSGQPSFMLRRYIEEGGTLHRLTPGTTDSELHFIIAATQFLESPAANTCSAAEATTILRSATAAMGYLRGNLLDALGRLEGADWRDTMEVRLRNTPLLSNTALLVKAYDQLGMVREAAELRTTIARDYWQMAPLAGQPTRTLIDWPWCAEEQPFDPLGGALAILHNAIERDRFDELLPWFMAVDSPTGVTIQCRHNPLDRAEAAVIDRTRGIVTWPFVVGFTVLAALKAAQEARTSKARGEWCLLASEQFDKLIALDGLAEWYDPATGQPHGAPRQLWSATLTLRAIDAMRSA